jgi:hypothetical protein
MTPTIASEVAENECEMEKVSFVKSDDRIGSFRHPPLARASFSEETRRDLSIVHGFGQIS